jgi:signal transduction histidine kinase
MPANAHEMSSVGNLIHYCQADIGAVWLRAVSDDAGLSGTASLLADLHPTLMAGLAALAELSPASANAVPPDESLRIASLELFQHGLTIAELVQALLLWKEATLHVFRRSLEDDPASARLLAGDLDAYLIKIISRFSHIYAEAVNSDHERQRKQVEKMLAENSYLYQQTQQRLAESQSLHRVTSSTLLRSNLQETLSLVCSEAVAQIGADWAAVYLSEPPGTTGCDAVAGHCPDARDWQDAVRCALSRPMPAGELWHLIKVESGDGSEERIGTTEVLVAPLCVRSEPVGALCLGTSARCRWQAHAEYVCALVAHAALAIESDHLQAQADRLVVIEERQRLARELHDSVTQSLYAVTLYAEASLRLLSKGDAPGALVNLEEAKATAQEALREMRLLIFELRPSALEKDGLIAALQYRLEAVEARVGIRTEFHVEGDDNLGPALQEEIYRIAQEALNNVLKHAQASRVTVELTLGADDCNLVVRDDGVGLDAWLSQARGGLGLSNMRERARRIGGFLSIEGKPGKGTEVRVSVPRSGR